MRRRLITIFSICLILMLVVLALAPSCAEPAPAPAPAALPGPPGPPGEGPPPAPPPPPPLPEGAIELRLSTHIPPFAPPVKLYQEWGQKLLEATNNKAGITVFAASSLVAGPDMLSGVKSGITDIGEVVLGWFEAQYPLSTILAFPFMPAGDAETAMKVWNDLEAKFPQMKAESKDFKVLVKVTTVLPALHTTDRQVRVPQDIKGLKLIASGASLGELVESQGASALDISVPDWYTSLERGLADGMFMEWGALVETKIYELLPYHTAIPSGVNVGLALFIMNLDSWNNLPPDVQQALDDLSVWMTEENTRINNARIAAAFETLKAAEGHKTYTCTPEENNLWFEAAVPIHQKRIAEIEAMGLPAQAVYDEILRLCAQYK